MQGTSVVNRTIPDPEDNKPIRGRRKSRWKLKFHHQALPAEYLDHYTASLNAAAATAVSSPAVTSPATAPPATVRYNDLPYMGEMTLDNARPRRGRKPKKADICHLIYKNYGTTVVDEPLNLCVRDLKAKSASEVSMCKFKFTGGATPSLEEKKMLSMDPSGNFRYYGGGEPQRRKSRKSLAREKLEKTFREKGFLIQTQQLESAQGATYCKFRQLRKFTRYLFRSWKHHLPGDVISEPVTETSLAR
ncbi:uncharacterized protein LOC128989968 [Macrosteles quadrilineatus]|uniref:uncharacterized protein LOC128989968 n=1 Tax=Macrosteles quadrilineatus TaxID=74068 RepID=UPI0023E1A5B3|nr:uncharacterized protein LOC128989968 [Macrosteles quadrilineatus]